MHCALVLRKQIELMQEIKKHKAFSSLQTKRTSCQAKMIPAYARAFFLRRLLLKTAYTPCEQRDEEAA
jgi:hypothetical protein